MNNKLDDWRKQIDAFDDELLHTLAKRINIVREIGKYKKAHNIEPLDEKRWQEILESRLSKASILDLPEDFIQKIFDLIHEYSLEVESESK